jgi:hypothetical protein
MKYYSSLETCIEHEFKSRIKTQRGIDSILSLADYQSILDYCQVTDSDVDMNLYNRLLYTIAQELIETTELQHEFQNRHLM